MSKLDLIILTRDRELHFCRAIREYCIAKNKIFKFINPFSELNSSVWDLVPKKVLIRTSGISFDDIDLMLATHWANQGSLVLNSPVNIDLFRNKEKAYFHLKNNHFPLIPTYFLRGEQSFSEQLFPNGIVFKPVRGNKGIGVKIFNDLKDAHEFWHGPNCDQRYMVQPKIPHFRDLRLFIVNNKVELSFYKDDPNCTWINVENLHSQSLKTHQELKLSYAAWDWVYHKESWLLNEVNLSPGFQRTPVSFQEKLLSYIV